MKLLPCGTIIRKSFWGDTIIEHEFAYISKKIRKCKKCGLEEMVINVTNGMHGPIQTWGEIYVKNKRLLH